MDKLNHVFTSVNKQFSGYELTPEISKLPSWYDAQVLRVGPAKYEYGDIKLNHWFDGLAMIYSFKLENNQILFSNKFIESEQYRSSQRGKMKYDEFGTRVSSKTVRLKSFFKSLLGLQIEKPSCNVNILKLDNKILATSEVTNLMQIEKTNISTVGEFRFNDGIKGQFSCAHPQQDPDTNEQFNFVTNITNKCKYTIYKIQEGSSKRESLFEFEDKDFIYNHSLFLTQNYIVLYLGPLRAKPTSFLTKSVSETIYYDNSVDCKFLVLNRKTLEAKYIDAPKFVFLHAINAYDKDGDIFLDFVEYPKCFEPYKELYLDKVKKEGANIESQASQIHINLKDNEITKNILTTNSVEFPVINKKRISQNYKYVYMSERYNNDLFYNCITKINLTDGSLIRYSFNEDFVSEPIFIANTNAEQEDDGIIFVNVIDNTKKLSYIVYLDAKDLTLIYKAYLPILIPPTLHGIALD